MSDVDVQIPSKAISDEEDVRKPVRDLLEDLNLLGSRTETEKAGTFASIFTGPSQSVALIEAGATAAAKWWAAGLGATVAVVWASVVGWWGNQESGIKMVVVGGAAFATAALVWSIGYLIASDVRGRSAAAVATIEARSRLAEKMIAAAQEAYKPASPAIEVQIVPLPQGVRVKNTEQPATNEEGWLALAMERHPDGSLKYIVVKGSHEATVTAAKLEFV